MPTLIYIHIIIYVCIIYKNVCVVLDVVVVIVFVFVVVVVAVVAVRVAVVLGLVALVFRAAVVRGVIARQPPNQHPPKQSKTNKMSKNQTGDGRYYASDLAIIFYAVGSILFSTGCAASPPQPPFSLLGLTIWRSTGVIYSIVTPPPFPESRTPNIEGGGWGATAFTKNK